MTTLTKAKLAIALVGVVLFGAGVRFQASELRWAGIGLVAVAWVLRFVRQKEEQNSPSTE